MTTIPDSIKAQLDADWTAAGGAEPAYYVGEDFRTNPPLGEDAVWIPTETLQTEVRPVNDTYANKFHLLDLIVNTQTSEDRLKELADEVERILNATAIANMNYQRILRRKNISDKSRSHYQELLTVDLREYMVTSAAAYGAGATGDFIATGDVYSSTAYSHEAALMLGSANAAWVPCAFEGVNVAGKALFSATSWALDNVDGTDFWSFWACPLATNKGGLKLYVSGIQIDIHDADGGDYITTNYVMGVDYDSADVVADYTNYQAAAQAQNLFTAVDMSGYMMVRAILNHFCTDAGDIGVRSVCLRCYYDT